MKKYLIVTLCDHSVFSIDLEHIQNKYTEGLVQLGDLEIPQAKRLTKRANDFEIVSFAGEIPYEEIALHLFQVDDSYCIANKSEDWARAPKIVVEEKELHRLIGQFSKKPL